MRAASNARSSSSSAGISVSGTYRPPNAPKRCAVSVATLVGRAMPERRGEELTHQPRVLDAGRGLHSRRDIDDVGRERRDRAGDVLGLEPAGEHDRGAALSRARSTAQLVPRERSPVPPSAPLHVRRASPARSRRPCRTATRDSGRDVRAGDSDRGPDLAAETSCERRGRLPCVGSACSCTTSRRGFVGGLRDLVGRVGPEHADALDSPPAASRIVAALRGRHAGAVRRRK